MKKIVRLTENDIRRIVKRVMNEAKSPLLLGDPDYKSNYSDSDEEDDDDNLSDDEFMSKYRYKDIPGWDTPNNKKLERIRRIRNKNRKGRGMNEALGLLDGDSDTPKSGRKMPKQYPTKHIKSREDAFYYTKGTKISARVLFDMYMKGTDIEVIMNPDNVTGPNGRHKKLFVLSTGQVYNELDEYMGNYKKEGFDKFEDYLES